MKKSKVILTVSIAAILCTSVIAVSTGWVPAGKITFGEKKELIKKMEYDFDEEHDKLLKGKVPATEKEINDNAIAGDNLKDKGIQVQKLQKEIEAEGGAPVPTKEEILKDINLGISIGEEAMENFVKNNPSKAKEDAKTSRNEPVVKQIETLKKLKDDLTNDKISVKDAWDKLKEIKGVN